MKTNSLTDKENEYDMEQKLQPFQLQSFDYSSDEYSEVYFITEETGLQFLLHVFFFNKNSLKEN